MLGQQLVIAEVAGVVRKVVRLESKSVQYRPSGRPLEDLMSRFRHR